MVKAIKLSEKVDSTPESPVIGVFATCDPRIDEDSRKRAVNIVKMAADKIAEDKSLAGKIVYPVA